tara:strand:+ start:1383 stop:1673 length:291 start_codon:yes stop_codon:yes gene_type:complete
MVIWSDFVIAFLIGVIIGLKVPREKKAFVVHGGYEMGKNLKAKECSKHNLLLYYGSKCSECAFEKAEEKFEEYQIARVEGFIPPDMTFEEWLGEEE